jgi:hypothetical protein
MCSETAFVGFTGNINHGAPSPWRPDDVSLPAAVPAQPRCWTRLVTNLPPNPSPQRETRPRPNARRVARVV